MRHRYITREGEKKERKTDDITLHIYAIIIYIFLNKLALRIKTDDITFIISALIFKFCFVFCFLYIFLDFIIFYEIFFVFFVFSVIKIKKVAILLFFTEF